MITYDKSPFGVNLLLRVNGSAVYRAAIPGALCVIVLILIREFWTVNDKDNHVEHPYAIGVLVASTTFLLVFRVQQGYARYWEAASAIHTMMSKWMDATMNAAAFHMQCAHYDAMKPPSFFDFPELNAGFLTRARERTSDSFEGDEGSTLHRAYTKSIERVHYSKRGLASVRSKRLSGSMRNRNSGDGSNSQSVYNEDPHEPVRLEGMPKLDGNWGELFKDGKATYFNPQKNESTLGFASSQGGRTPPLFLQELSHLSSLLTGVALSTLRNDIEGAQSPLDIYDPGSEWPQVDPNKDSNSAYRLGNTAMSGFMRFIGFGRSAQERSLYNASRPLPVLGGVSDSEIKLLQMARGPYAKTMLCSYWLSEFLTREHLAGSTGNVGAPIISRIHQFLSDGTIFYNHARKIMFIPFPFPHAQLSVVYVLVTVPAIAVLMEQYADDLWFGCILAFLTATCLAGIHEVARELENPFRNHPNELPVVTLQAQFNEALVTMYAGYHPDLFWAEEAKKIDEMMVSSEDEARPGTEDSTMAATTTESAKEDKAQASPKLSSSPEVEALNKRIDDLLKKISAQDAEIEQMRTSLKNE